MKNLKFKIQNLNSLLVTRLSLKILRFYGSRFTGYGLRFTIFCILLSVICVLLSVFWVYAQDSEEGAIFLDLPQSAKVQSLANCYVAGAEGIEASFSNPAGLTDNTYKTQFQTSYTPLYNLDTKYTSYSYVYNLAKLSLALTTNQLVIDNIPHTLTDFNTSREIKGYFGDKETNYNLHLAKKLNEQTSIGLSLKTISQKLFNQSSKATGIDLSLKHKQNDTLNFGLVIKNITTTKVKWSTGTKEKLTPSFQLGVSKKTNNLQLEINLKKQKDTGTEILGSVQYTLSPLLQVRGGYNKQGLSLGIGLKLANFNLDYGYQNQELSGVNMLSVGVGF